MSNRPIMSHKMIIFLKFAKRNGKFMKENAALVANMKISALKKLEDRIPFLFKWMTDRFLDKRKVCSFTYLVFQDENLLMDFIRQILAL